MRKKSAVLAAVFFTLFLLHGPAHAKYWTATGLTGGGNAVDGINITALNVQDGDLCRAWNDSGTVGYFLEYHYISGDSTAEDSPLVIAPDTGTGRWHLSRSSYKCAIFSIENPTSSENIGSFRFAHSGTIFKVVGVVKGTSPSVTIQLKHNTDRSAATANLFSAPQAVTSTTTGDVDTSGWDDNTFAVDEFLWLTTVAKSGTVTMLEVTVWFAYH